MRWYNALRTPKNIRQIDTLVCVGGEGGRDSQRGEREIDGLINQSYLVGEDCYLHHDHVHNPLTRKSIIKSEVMSLFHFASIQKCSPLLYLTWSRAVISKIGLRLTIEHGGKTAWSIVKLKSRFYYQMDSLLFCQGKHPFSSLICSWEFVPYKCTQVFVLIQCYGTFSSLLNSSSDPLMCLSS